MLRYKIDINIFKKVEIISSIFSDQNETTNQSQEKKKEPEKHTKTWRLNNMLLNNKWVNNEIKKKIKRPLNQMKMRTQQPKFFGTCKLPEREIHSQKVYPKEQEKSQ